MTPAARAEATTLDLVEAIGRTVQERWAAAGDDPRHLPEIATAALSEAALAERVRPSDLIRWAFGQDELPPQRDRDARFGEPPLTLYNGVGFIVQALFWTDAVPLVHEHTFPGAFQVLDGSSIHTSFAFRETRALDVHVRLGVLTLADVELLRPGDTRPIVPGVPGIHALSHPDRPSVTLVVSGVHDPATGPEHAYLPPSIAWDPLHVEMTAQRQLQLLGLLIRTADASLPEMAARIVRRGDPSATLEAIVKVAPVDNGALADELVDVVREADAEYADAIAAALPEAHRYRRTLATRNAVDDVEERFMLGLLLHGGGRPRILELIRDRHPTADPATLATAWCCSILRQTHTIDVSPAGRDHLRSLLDPHAPPAAEPLTPADAKAVAYLTRGSRVFAPLYSQGH